MTVVFELDIFGGRLRDMRSQVRGRVSLLWLLESLTRINQLYLRYAPKTPLIYRSGVRYEAETDTEEWCDIPTLLARGYGDCEDLAAWRTAELRERFGIPARPHLTWRPIGETWRFHALVQMPDGKLEDPSRALGMGAGRLVMSRR